MQPENTPKPLWKKPFAWVLLVVVSVGITYFVMQPPRNAVAMVDGTIITKTAFNERFDQLRNFYQSQGADISDPGFLAQSKRQTLDSMINEMLIEQAAKKEGIVTDPTEVDAAYQELIASELNASSTLASSGLSGADIKKNIATQMVIGAYVTKHTMPADLAVSDTDIEALYDNLKRQDPSIPDIEIVHDNLAKQIRGQKIDWATTQLVSKLKEQSSINTYITF